MNQVPTSDRAPSAELERKRHSQIAEVLVRLWREKPLATVGGIIVLFMVLVGLSADLISPYPMDQMNLRKILQGPSLSHPFGTDEIGRDLLSRMIFGARISLMVGIVGSVYATIVSTAIGLLSGYFGGRFD